LFRDEERVITTRRVKSEYIFDQQEINIKVREGAEISACHAGEEKLTLVL
jgi:hypothetical protein